MTDFTNLVGRKQLKSHKIIMTRSTVFAAMFEIDEKVGPLASVNMERDFPIMSFSTLNSVSC